MSSHSITPQERRGLRARAHFLDPIVIIGEAGLSPGVLLEIERGLEAHELIKVRVATLDREGREAIQENICAQTGALSVQHIGKLLVLYRPALPKTEASTTSGKKRMPAKTPAKSGKGTASAQRKAPLRDHTSTRKAPSGSRPPRTSRVRKSGQRSAKKPFQGN
ncbi:MAG: ribosome assembly RNA-binding protein YhbY [Burkholderiaceae bacterium]|jgi:putative YhbY family RNA-binding protein